MGQFKNEEELEQRYQIAKEIWDSMTKSEKVKVIEEAGFDLE